MLHQHLFILPRKEGKSGAVRHSHLLLPIIFHWKEVGPDRLVLVNTSRYKIHSFPTRSSPVLYPTYIHNINATHSTKHLSSLKTTPLYKLSTLYSTRTISPQTKKEKWHPSHPSSAPSPNAAPSQSSPASAPSRKPSSRPSRGSPINKPRKQTGGSKSDMWEMLPCCKFSTYTHILFI
jgi:hypothetical protein